MRSDRVDQSILDSVGNTALIELRTAVPTDAGRVLVKLETSNPTGSMKDRMALAMIEAAENDGRLQPGGTVVEYTGGSTGVSLAQVCACKGYALHIVTSDAFSAEKRQHMRALGADLTVIPSNDGAMDEALTRSMIDTAAAITAETGGLWTDQLNNRDQVAGYKAMGEEIWRQTGGILDAFVQSVGTAGSIVGNARALREHHPGIEVVAVEPAESAVLSGERGGAHRIEGIGAGFVVPLWDPQLVDAVLTYSTEEAMQMTRRLARDEGIFAGTSTGANVLGAVATARRLGPDSTVVTVACDSGIKYLSTDLYESTSKSRSPS